MYYLVVVLFICVCNEYSEFRLLLSDGFCVCLGQVLHLSVYTGLRDYICFKLNGTKFVFAVTYHSYHLAHIRLKGYSSQKSIDILLNPFCIKLVTIYLSACNFAIAYLYKEIKFNSSSKLNIPTNSRI